MSIVGVFCDLLATMRISLSLGIPRVTFISPLPAKWKVLRVICVDGSPIDCNTVPSLTTRLRNDNRRQVLPINHLSSDDADSVARLYSTPAGVE